MDETLPLDPLVIERRDGFLLTGLRRRYTMARDLGTVMQGVSDQWLCLRPRKAEVRKAVCRDAYGVCLKMFEGDATFDYFCGMEVTDASNLPEGFTTLAIPPLRYAVFRYHGIKALLPTVYFAIFGRLLPEAGLLPAASSSDAPEFIEHFGPGYNVTTETGGPDIMVPLKD